MEIEVTDGPEISYSFDGKNYTEVFSGKKMHGRTPQLSRADKLEKAFVFLPKSPPISVPSGVRLAGSGILKVIAFHELLHAVGLSNGEHAPDDVFQEQPQYFPGDTPVEDWIMIPNTTKHMPPSFSQKPPLKPSNGSGAHQAEV